MDFIDKLSKTVSHGIERARFEAEKFQKTSRIQGELNDIKKMLDSKMIELGHRAYDLFRARQISSPSIAELAQTIDDLRSRLVLKEDEMKEAQSVAYVEPESTDEKSSGPPPHFQHIPIEREPMGSGSSYGKGSGPGVPDPSQQTKSCPSCGFLMPQRAKYCPRCGHYVGSSS